MSLISVIIIIVLVGVLVWAVNRFIPMADNIKTFLNIAVVVILAFWILGLLGLIPDLNAIKVGK